ncbi:hypothetical protein EJ06DRAFT_263542 [Trichodelitschia bisporula]|uniref:Uncharacterized protein n=1 Tax=Trichodelitschia bisporula TaxID=703511 RepID=A0A6G1HIV6_9PEZI|nr:hypothetical protein EJ06DRAFT_263542 [Trichodelitschia bisporula]
MPATPRSPFRPTDRTLQYPMESTPMPLTPRRSLGPHLDAPLEPAPIPATPRRPFPSTDRTLQDPIEPTPMPTNPRRLFRPTDRNLDAPTQSAEGAPRRPFRRPFRLELMDRTLEAPVEPASISKLFPRLRWCDTCFRLYKMCGYALIPRN